jgi:hypothetical protein
MACEPCRALISNRFCQLLLNRRGNEISSIGRICRKSLPPAGACAVEESGCGPTSPSGITMRLDATVSTRRWLIAAWLAGGGLFLVAPRSACATCGDYVHSRRELPNSTGLIESRTNLPEIQSPDGQPRGRVPGHCSGPGCSKGDPVTPFAPKEVVPAGPRQVAISSRIVEPPFPGRSKRLAEVPVTAAAHGPALAPFRPPRAEPANACSA